MPSDESKKFVWLWKKESFYLRFLCNISFERVEVSDLRAPPPNIWKTVADGKAKHCRENARTNNENFGAGNPKTGVLEAEWIKCMFFPLRSCLSQIQKSWFMFSTFSSLLCCCCCCCLLYTIIVYFYVFSFSSCYRQRRRTIQHCWPDSVWSLSTRSTVRMLKGLQVSQFVIKR